MGFRMVEKFDLIRSLKAKGQGQTIQFEVKQLTFIFERLLSISACCIGASIYVAQLVPNFHKFGFVAGKNDEYDKINESLNEAISSRNEQ